MFLRRATTSLPFFNNKSPISLIFLSVYPGIEHFKLSQFNVCKESISLESIVISGSLAIRLLNSFSHSDNVYQFEPKSLTFQLAV